MSSSIMTVDAKLFRKSQLPSRLQVRAGRLAKEVTAVIKPGGF